jgi:hypothetical protein
VSHHLTNLTINGTAGYTFMRDGDRVAAFHRSGLMLIPLAHVSALVYRHTRYHFLLVLVIALLGLAYTVMDDYELLHFAGYSFSSGLIPLALALALTWLYAATGTAAMVVHAGSFQAFIRGEKSQLEAVIQLFRH